MLDRESVYQVTYSQYGYMLPTGMYMSQSGALYGLLEVGYVILAGKWSSRMLNIMLILSAFKKSPFHSQKL